MPRRSYSFLRFVYFRIFHHSSETESRDIPLCIGIPGTFSLLSSFNIIPGTHLRHLMLVLCTLILQIVRPDAAFSLFPSFSPALLPPYILYVLPSYFFLLPLYLLNFPLSLYLYSTTCYKQHQHFHLIVSLQIQTLVLPCIVSL